MATARRNRDIGQTGGRGWGIVIVGVKKGQEIKNDKR